MGSTQYSAWGSKQYAKGDPLAPENQPQRSRARKDTKRWCRGKVGVAHQPHQVFRPQSTRIPTCQWATSMLRDRGVIFYCHHVTACRDCGKIVDHTPAVGDCPDWVPSVECSDQRDATTFMARMIKENGVYG